MFGIVKGEDFLVFKRFDSRRDAEEYVAEELNWYNLEYSNPEYSQAMTNKEFWNTFPEYVKYSASRRLGKKLTKRIEG
jgi:hypothetical protein